MMNFKDAIIETINQFGRGVIGEARFVNILSDMHGYKDFPACKRILSVIIKDGTNGKLFLKPTFPTEAEIRQTVILINKQYGFQEDLIEYVLYSIRNSLMPVDERINHFSRQYEYIGQENEYGLREVHNNGKTGVIDSMNREIVPIVYDSIGSFNEGVATVEQNGKYGYVDTSGKVIIPLQFDTAYSFKHHIAKVRNAGKFGLINKQGIIILPIHFESISYESDGYIGIQQAGKWGFCDTSGNVVIKPRYHKIIKPFSKGYAAVNNGGSIVIIDNKGNIIKKY